jgi:hypothetical protein
MVLTAGDLINELRPPVDGEKSLTLTISPGKRPVVIFTGMWTGKYIKAAMDSIAKCYRVSGRTTRRMGETPTPKVEITQTQVIPEGGK